MERIVGTLELVGKNGIVFPDGTRGVGPVFVPARFLKGAKNNQKVAVRLFNLQGPYGPIGVVTRVLGDKGDPQTDFEVVIEKNGIRKNFPKRVLEEASLLPDSISERDVDGRVDLRGWLTVTIDGEDAKDFDDAVSIRKTPDGYVLGVHIADVSHYVREASAIDREAMLRGTSVYLIDRAVHMLPPKLSAWLCSLVEGRDRLAVSVIARLTRDGEPISCEFVRSVIRVDRRLTYGLVNRVLERGETDLVEPKILEMLEAMAELAQLLRKHRKERGAIDLDVPEPEIEINDRGEATSARRAERGIGEKIIEEFMIFANEQVAEALFWGDFPAIYRVHEPPDPSDIRKLNRVLSSIGYKVKGVSNPHPKAFQRVVEEARGRPEANLVSRAVLLSMKRAGYSTDNIGHFGLASTCYLHFTSPIRRYPDLAVHRLVKRFLIYGKTGWSNKRLKYLEKIAEMCTEAETKAERAERDICKIKLIELMGRHLGEDFEGVVSGVMPFGFFVELVGNTAEGLVRTETLDERFTYRERDMALIGERTGRVIRIGDRVVVKPVRADKDRMHLDFVLVSHHSRLRP